MAALLLAPHLVWQVLNDWPTLDFMARASAEKIWPITPLELLTGNIERGRQIAVGEVFHSRPQVKALTVGPFNVPPWGSA